jgi:hypothetical protein
MSGRAAVATIFVVAVLSASAAHAFCFGIIHVHVFNDRNANGAMDNGESGLHGVVVQLDQNGDGTIEDTKTTDGNGDVDFFGPAVVPYRIRIVLPAGAMQTTANPPDVNMSCNGVTNVSIGLAPAAQAPAFSRRMLALLALSLAGIALVVIRR